MDLKIKMNQLNDIDLWEKIIYALNGTCDAFSSVLSYYDAEQLEDYMPFLQYLDNEIFCCNDCNWWYSISEMADDDEWHCESCAEN